MDKSSSMNALNDGCTTQKNIAGRAGAGYA